MRKYTCGGCGDTAETEDTKPKGQPVVPDEWASLTITTMPMFQKLLCPRCIRRIRFILG